MRIERLNPEVPDYFHRVPFAAAEEHLWDLFHSGCLAVIEDYPWEAADLEVFRKAKVMPNQREAKSVDRQYEKMKPDRFMLPLDDKGNMLLGVYPDREEALAAQKAWARLQKQVKATLINGAFGRRANLRDGTDRWRVSETTSYGLHLDFALDPRDFWVKVFVNLDSQSRIWRTGPQYDEVVKARGREAVDEGSKIPGKIEIRNERNDACRWLSLDNKDWMGTLPTHEVHFEPGDVWILDGSAVSHEIVFGRNMATFSYRFEHEK